MLIVMPVYCTPENERAKGTYESVNALLRLTDWSQHRLILVDNASTDQSVRALLRTVTERSECAVFESEENYLNNGAFNFGLSQALPGEDVVIMEDDVVVYAGWDITLQALAQKSDYSGLALCPDVFHTSGWLMREFDRTNVTEPEYGVSVTESRLVWNGCTYWKAIVRETIGYFRPPRQGYGYNDYFYCLRARQAGFKLAHIWGSKLHYVPSPSANHPYRQWKRNDAHIAGKLVPELHQQYVSGARPLFEPINPPEMIIEPF